MGIVKWTTESIGAFINERGYKLIELVKYNGVNSTIIIKCPLGHKSQPINFNGFKNGSNCRECNKNNLRKKFSFTYSEVKDIFQKEGYKLISETYINANSLLSVQCPSGHIMNNMTLGNFKSGHRCAICSGNRKHNLEYIKEFLGQYHYELISNQYDGSNKYIDIKCPKNHIFPTKFSRFQQGHRCPICNIYKGEEAIRKVLKKYNLYYKYQKTFPNLVGVRGGVLSYDFYIEEINTLIEYQGEFHVGVPKIQSEKKLKIQMEHDRRKREYAKKNKIKLIEIWYYDFDRIETILKEKLNIII